MLAGMGVKFFRCAALVAASVVASAGAAEAGCKVKRFAELPVTMRGRSPLVPVEVNGNKVQFLVDSGAFYSMIDRSRANEFKLTLSAGSTFLVQGVAGDADSYATTVKTFSLAGTSLSNLPFVVASGGGGEGAAGLLGQNILGIGDAEYDFPHGAVRLYTSEGCNDFTLAYWAKDRHFSVISIRGQDSDNRQTVGEVFVNGKRMTATFDTGAYDSVLSRQAAARAGIDVNAENVTPISTSGGIGGGRMRTWIAPVQSFKIGDEEIHDTKLQVAEMSNDTDMLLGADFFAAHRVYVSNSQRKLYFTYEGGPVFSAKSQAFERQGDNTIKATTVAPTNEGEPKDADAYARRGAARQTRHDLEGALADFDRACALAPTEARYLILRAAALRANKQSDKARADLDQALKLKPDDAEALVERADLKLEASDRDGAFADVEIANRLVTKEADLQIELGGLYQRIERFDLAIPAYDKWLASHPDNYKIADALSERCWARTQLGQELDRALDDCNRALRLAPKTAGMLESRGFTHLRRGENEAAIADYDFALKLDTELTWARYGRGVAKLRLGKAEEAKADLAAGLANNPKLKELFLKRGIAKPGEL